MKSAAISSPAGDKLSKTEKERLPKIENYHVHIAMFCFALFMLGEFETGSVYTALARLALTI